MPGYVAVADGMEFSLQGSPHGVDGDGYFYFDFVCYAVGVDSLLLLMGDLTKEVEPEGASRSVRRSSAFLRARLMANTTLTCDAD